MLLWHTHAHALKHKHTHISPGFTYQCINKEKALGAPKTTNMAEIWQILQESKTTTVERFVSHTETETQRQVWKKGWWGDLRRWRKTEGNEKEWECRWKWNRRRKRITRKCPPKKEGYYKRERQKGVRVWIKLSCREEEKSEKKTRIFDRQEKHLRGRTERRAVGGSD